MKSAVFSCQGFGYGLIALELGHNLAMNGEDVTILHPQLSVMQSWFPHSLIQKAPPIEELREWVAQYDRFFVFYETSGGKLTPFNERLLALLEEEKKQALIINPFLSPYRSSTYGHQTKFKTHLCFAENIELFCKEILHLPKTTLSTGVAPPSHLISRRHKNRVVIHPTSANAGKNWPQEKYLKLAKWLKKQGYHPVAILPPEESAEWSPLIEAPIFENFAKAAAFVYESGYMIGNDSSIGHLASCLGLPTLSIFNNARLARFNRPGWHNPSSVVAPMKHLPNFKGFRLRDKYWKKWVSVRKVCRAFKELAL